VALGQRSELEVHLLSQKRSNRHRGESTQYCSGSKDKEKQKEHMQRGGECAKQDAMVTGAWRKKDIITLKVVEAPGTGWEQT